MYIHPNYVYKYKSIEDFESLDRIIDIIENRRIYVPLRREINDPFESSSVRFFLATSGAGYQMKMGYFNSVIEGILEKYRFLSLSEVYDSTVMWASYGKEFSGCCLVFKTDNTLYNIQPIVYTDNYIELHEVDSKIIEKEDIDDLVRESLLFKRREWQHEYEWRLILETKKPYYSIQNDIVGIIIGHRMKEQVKRRIIETCEKMKMPLLETRLSYSYSEIKFVPCDEDYSGLMIREINERVQKKADASLRGLYLLLNKLERQLDMML